MWLILADRKCYVDDGHASDIKDIEHLGTIEMRIWRVTFTVSREDWVSTGLQPDGVGAVHERSKKAGSHCVTWVMVHLS